MATYINVAGEETPLLQPSTPTGGNRLLRRNNSELPHKKTSSFWKNDSSTPMTTHPHFDLVNRSPRLHRVRSQSLGAEVEANLFLPSLVQQQEPSNDASAPARKKNSSSTAGTQISTNGSNDDDDDASKLPPNPVWISVMYGMINAAIVLPVIMSFGNIIYRDQAFDPYMPVLVKLTVVSGVVHQLCFSTFSSLPFAVGQVQDAGLIFLSQMASRMVQYCQAHGHDDVTMLATTTIGLSLCTACLGVGLYLIGHYRLAQYVQMLPTSVVGGYLAYIGWFCGESGVALMAGSSSGSVKAIVASWEFVLPGLLGGLFIYACVRQFRHMAVLPSCIACLIVVFYGILLVTGTSIESARDSGWIREMEPATAWYKTWDYLRLDKVAWGALPDLVLTELGMIFVVALSSSLDVAAIELELNSPLDYNHELKTVGISNILSGITGGYTGSYIFSQSIFSLRAGIRTRLAGYVLALCQIVYLVLPFPVLSFVPNFFFGSLLSMIAIDLMYEWLWDVRTKLTPLEYVVCLATFGLIQLLTVEYGIIAGVGLYIACQKLGLDVGEPKIITQAPETEVQAIGRDEEAEGESLGLVITA